MHEREQARRGERAAQHAALQPRPAFAAAGAAHRLLAVEAAVYLLLLDVLPGCVAEFLAAARLLAA